MQEERTVLIVNDTPDQLHLMSVVLRKVGYKILTAEDGLEAFPLALRQRPDLIVSDVKMPGAGGIELCRMIRSEPSLQAVPILLSSAVHKDSESAIEGIQAGADDYLEAPFDPMLLIAKVSRLIERKRAAAELQRSEERFRRLFEENVTGVFIATAEGNLLACNPAFTRIFGFACDEDAMESNLSAIYPDSDAWNELLARIKREKRLEYVEVELHSLDGKRIQGVENIIGTFDEHGELTELLGYIFDDTPRQELEKQLLQSQKMEAIGTLAGGVAHDFNNLLTVILGYSDLLLLRLAVDSPLRRHTEEIKQAAQRAAGLTRQLLAFSRKQVLQPRVLNLNTVVAEIDKLLQRLIGEDIELRTMLDQSLGSVKADSGQIEQVVMNLAVNARDAMPGGGKLTIKTANVYLDEDYAGRHLNISTGPYVMLAISDNGHGMSEETHAHIFEPFFTTKGSDKGTGLGLSTVYGIVRQSGGGIWVYSEEGRGATFKIYLPRVDEEAEEYVRKAKTPETPRGTETILLLEDDETVRRLTLNVLKLGGYQVLEAVDAKSAVAFGETHPREIHLLLTDVVMPGLGGREMASRLAVLRPQMKVLYMSGYIDDSIVHHGMLDAGTEFLEKPFTPDTLARKVREVLDKN